jgi:hypothetical protein
MSSIVVQGVAMRMDRFDHIGDATEQNSFSGVGVDRSSGLFLINGVRMVTLRKIMLSALLEYWLADSRRFSGAIGIRKERLDPVPSTGFVCRRSSHANPVVFAETHKSDSGVANSVFISTVSRKLLRNSLITLGSLGRSQALIIAMMYASSASRLRFI